MTRILRRRRPQKAEAAPSRVGGLVTPSPHGGRAEGTVARRGWEDLHSEVVGEMRKLGRVDASSVDDLVTERAWWR